MPPLFVPGEHEAFFVERTLTLSLENYDFSRVPSLDRELFMGVFSEDFVECGENALLVAGAGMGKTHLCVALACVVAARDQAVCLVRDGDFSSDPGEKQMFPGGGSREIGQGLFDCDLLVIDELPDFDHRLLGLLDSRFSQGRSTFFATRALLDVPALTRRLSAWHSFRITEESRRRRVA